MLENYRLGLANKRDVYLINRAEGFILHRYLGLVVLSRLSLTATGVGDLYSKINHLCVVDEIQLPNINLASCVVHCFACSDISH
jgi:hypothetical protein